MSLVNYDHRHKKQRDQNYSSMSQEERENFMNEQRQKERIASQIKALTLTVQPSRFRLPFRPGISVTVVLENKNTCAISFAIDTNSPTTLAIEPETGCLFPEEEAHIAIGRPTKLPSRRTKEYLVFKIKYCKYCNHNQRHPQQYEESPEFVRRAPRTGEDRTKDFSKQPSRHPEITYEHPEFPAPKKRHSLRPHRGSSSTRSPFMNGPGEKVYIVTNEYSDPKQPINDDFYPKKKSTHKIQWYPIKSFEPEPRFYFKGEPDDAEIDFEDYPDPEHTCKRPHFHRKPNNGNGSRRVSQLSPDHEMTKYSYDYDPSFQLAEDMEYQLPHTSQAFVPTSMPSQDRDDRDPSPMLKGIKRCMSNVLGILSPRGSKDGFLEVEHLEPTKKKCTCLNCATGGDDMDRRLMDHIRHNGQKQGKYYLTPDGRMHIFEEDLTTKLLSWLPYLLLFISAAVIVVYVGPNIPFVNDYLPMQLKKDATWGYLPFSE